MNKYNNKIWLRRAVKGVFRIMGAGMIFVGSLAWASAQSSSASYKAVDFLNPEASLTTSSASYKLSDSVDYYGGIAKTSGSSVQACTGDYAVLSNCGQSVTPPIPPTPVPIPSSGGSAVGGPSTTPTNCTTPDCQSTPPEENPTPVEPPTEPEKPPFKLPDITEPVPTTEQPVVTNPVVRPSANRPSVNVVQKPVETQPIVQPTEETTGGLYQGGLPTPLCEDVACSETNLLRPSGLNKTLAEAKKAAADQACQLYVFGGYQFHMNCSDASLVMAAVLFSVLGLSGITFGVQPVVSVAARIGRGIGLRRRGKGNKK